MRAPPLRTAGLIAVLPLVAAALPMHVGLLLDTMGSMETDIRVRLAAPYAKIAKVRTRSGYLTPPK